MAQETVIHRVDAELGAGTGHAPIPADLAVDGIDELLEAFVAYGSRTYPDEYADVLGGTDGRAVAIRTDTRAWLVRPTPAELIVAESTVDPGAADGGATAEGGATSEGGAAAVVSGPPASLLLSLWNRGGDEALSYSGDAELIGLLRQLLRVSTA